MLKARQFHSQDGGLETGQPIVVALETRAITLLLAPATQQRRSARVLPIVGGEHTAFTSRAEVFARVETEAADIAHASGGASAILGAVGLGRVFDDDQLVAS